MELIKNKIKENVEKQKELIALADEIQNLKSKEAKTISNYDDIIGKMVGKLTNERILTEIRLKDLLKKKEFENSWYYNDTAVLGINKSGIGYKSGYSKNLSQLHKNVIRKILLNNCDKFKPLFKTKQNSLDIINTFETNLSELNEINEIKCNFKLSTTDFNDETNSIEEAKFKTNSPCNLSKYSADIQNIEYYIMIEEKYNDIKNKYTETIYLMEINNQKLELELQKLKNAFSSWLIVDEI